MSEPTPASVDVLVVGGGEGAFIGAVHRMAAALDGDWDLVAGAFSTDAGRNTRTGTQLGLAPARVYASFEAMIAEVAVHVDVGRPRHVALAVLLRTGRATHEVAHVEHGEATEVRCQLLDRDEGTVTHARTSPVDGLDLRRGGGAPGGSGSCSRDGRTSCARSSAGGRASPRTRRGSAGSG